MKYRELIVTSIEFGHHLPMPQAEGAIYDILHPILEHIHLQHHSTSHSSLQELHVQLPDLIRRTKDSG